MAEPSARDFDGLLSALNFQLLELLSCLRNETEVLADPRTQGLDEAITCKQTALQQVSDLEQERQRRCASLGVDSAPAAMAAHCEALGDGSANTWQQVLGLLEQCQQQNLTNGSILALRQRFAAGALAVLRGNGIAEDTYLPSGARSQPGINRRYLPA